MCRILVALAPALALACLALLIDPIAQPSSYHLFHDDRAMFGIPNFFNVISNAPFFFVGAAALLWLLRNPADLPAHLVSSYAIMACGIVLTAIGSSYYHWAPGNAALFWDRLPIALTAMGLFSAFLTERLRLEKSVAWAVLAGLVLYGCGSTLYWHHADDLRFYLIAQFYPLLAIPVLMYFYPATYTRSRDWIVALSLYGLAKLFELLDGSIYAAGHLAGGHMFKHLLAALAVYWIFAMLKKRQAHEPALPRPCPQRGQHDISGGGICRADICNCY